MMPEYNFIDLFLFHWCDCVKTVQRSHDLALDTFFANLLVPNDTLFAFTAKRRKKSHVDVDWSMLIQPFNHSIRNKNLMCSNIFVFFVLRLASCNFILCRHHNRIDFSRFTTECKTLNANSHPINPCSKHIMYKQVWIWTGASIRDLSAYECLRIVCT